MMSFGLDDIRECGLDVFHTGSREICNPAPTDTDDDYLVTCPNIASHKMLVKCLEASGWTLSGKEYALSAGSQSWRRGDQNLIVTSDSILAQRWKTATHICKRLNALKKQDRIDVFQAVTLQSGPLAKSYNEGQEPKYIGDFFPEAQF
jgi:hypothetical protein